MVYVASLNDQVVPSKFLAGDLTQSRAILIITSSSVFRFIHHCITSFDSACTLRRWGRLSVSLVIIQHLLILTAFYRSSDFLSNLLILLLRIMNSGISDSGLLAHLSEVTAGSLNGVGHSTAYEELATYS